MRPLSLALALMTMTAATAGLSSFQIDAHGVTEFTNYDALAPAKRRKAAPSRLERVDTTLTTSKRSALSANTDDLVKNFAIAQWMIRKHLDYVSQFDFHAETGDRGLDAELERLMRRDARPDRCDVARRFSREKMFRLAELRRTVDGDLGLLKLASGHMQGIESDLVRDPPRKDRTNGVTWVNGVSINPAGRPLHYALHSRGDGGRGYKFQRVVPARRMFHYGYFDHFAGEQTRGVSPIVSALNPLRDVHENFDYALVKAKVSQLFALAFYRQADEAAGDVENADEDVEGHDGDAEDKSGYTVDFGKGPVLLDLEPGDRAEFLESNQPSTQLQAFAELVIAVALKSLDIPFSFYDESKSTFFGSRGAWLHYERSCKDKRDDQVELRRKYTTWRLMRWIRDGELTLPARATLEDLRYEWVARGMPWWDPSKEVRGDVLAIAAGLDAPQRIVKDRGRGDFESNVDQIIAAIKYARDRGNEELGEPLTLSFDPGPDPIEANVVDNA